MNYDDKRIAGLLGFVAGVQIILAIIICEAVYSGYSVGQQYISDLGNWSLARANPLLNRWDAKVIRAIIKRGYRIVSKF